MADSTNPNAGKTTSSSFLPRFYRSDSNKKFLQATVDQLIQPGTVKKVNGYIGRQNSKATTGADIFVVAADQTRQNYQLEPGLVLKDELGNNIFFKDYIDYINQLSVFGSNVKNHERLNKQEFYSWNPHICWDKFVNFQNYYWLPYGPDAIRVYGQAEKVSSTYNVTIESQGDNNAYIFSSDSVTGLVRNPLIKLYRGQTYTFNINSPGNPFSIKTARSSGPWDKYQNPGISGYAVENGTITFAVPYDAPDVLYYQSEADADLGGVFQILSITDNTKLDVEAEILGKKEYSLSDGTPLSNGMKLSFGGTVTPVSYSSGFYYVEGVGTSIKLVSEASLALVSAYSTAESVLFDSNPFDSLPFGEATAFAGSVDYIVVNRASVDRNPWSRYNRWFHKDVVESSAKFNGKVASLNQSSRAVRPIVEFEAGLKLFNFGTVAVADVDLVDTFTEDVFSTVEGSFGYNIDGIDVINGQRILFTADTDTLVKNRIYQVEFIDVLHNSAGSRQIHLVLVDEPELNQTVLVKQGAINQGKMYWYNGTAWNVAQQKISLNQHPLFDIVDSNGVSYSDFGTYDGSTFTGTKLFSYKDGSGTADKNLGFALSYKNIENIGDIVFNFNLETDTFQYKNIADVISQHINSGYLVLANSLGEVSYANGWQVNTLTTVQPAIRIYKNFSNTQEFDLDIFDDKNNLSDLVVRVYVNGNRLDPSLWSLVDAPTYKKIILNNSIATDDILTIKAFASQPINSNGYYEIPVNLQNNPLNDSITDFTLGEVIDHVNSIVDNLTTFSGTYPGSSNLRDLGNVSSLGTKFVQHSSPASLPMYHVTSETNNVVRAIERSRDDYNKFKRNFIAIAEVLGVDADPVTQVNLILQKINKDKPKTFPYYFSDMVPYGAVIKNDFTVIDYRIKTYPLTNTFSLNELSNKAVGVYLNGNQLCHGSEYTFSDQGFVVISADIVNDDIISIYEYDNTDGCFIPETPTKLGIWPKYTPKIYTDTSLVTPRIMIQGHDGSQVLAYGDFRDELILEVEKRIYNNIKVEYDPSIFDISDVIPSYNRTNDYSLTEFNEVLAPNFYKWATLIDRDFTKPLSFDRLNPMTFNYRGHTAPDGRETPGYWRGIYRWILDTDRPNICPWEMLGFTEEPSWWTSVYGPAPYTSDNLIMWSDIASGLVKEPGKTVVKLDKYAKPFLLDYIPVDENGNILSPILSGLSSGTITTSTEGDFVFGDISPIEGAWRRSSHYPFSVILTALLLKPAKTFGVLLDRSRIVKNLTGQLVYKDTGLRIRPVDIKLPSIVTSENRVQTSGIINYLINYIVGNNLAYFNEYAYGLKNLTCQISHRVGAFTSKEKFKLLLDSKSPTATGSVFVPQEDYEIVLNSSSPIKKITYSGVIITKLQDGFEVKGYSITQPYFKYYPWIQSGIAINVGGISESYSLWTAGQQYASGKIVEYNNRFYRSKVLHTADSTFNLDYYQPLPSLPIVGGRNAILRKLWDRTDPITVPYGTKFREIQEVVDFLTGYGEWLKDQGFIFDDFNTNIEQVTNWETSAKEFLFWTTQNWSTGEDKWEDWLPETAIAFGSIIRYNGDYYRAIRNSEASVIFPEDDFVKLDGLSTVGSSVISLSPAAAKLTFNAPLSVVDDIRNQFNGYEIFAVDGKPIPPNFLNSYREDNAVSYTPSGEDGIYGASFYLVQKEQVVILNNSTMFNDTIYNIASGYKQDRVKVSGYVSTDWYGAFDVPGFVFDQATIAEWEVWKDYALGDIVKYKEFYYTANSFVAGTESFVFTDWYKLDKKPSAQLLPNWTYKAEQFTDFYDLDSDNFDVTQQKMAQHLIGYQKRQYLENIIQDDVSEFKFYQGMIIEKGTQNVFNKLFDVLSASGQESLKFYEEWALRVGRYGANNAYDNIEFILDESEFKNNPQGFELVDVKDPNKVDFISRQDPNDIYLKPLGYNSNPWPLDLNYRPYLRSAGYVRPDDVLYTIKSLDNITDVNSDEEFLYPIETFNEGDYVWCTFESSSWNVYRYVNAGIKIVDIVYNGDNDIKTITITTEDLIDLPVGSYFGLSQMSTSNGFYKIQSVSLNTMVAVTTQAWPSLFTEQDRVSVCKLVSYRVSSINDADQIFSISSTNGEKVWTDNNGSNKWASWEFNKVYSESLISVASPATGLQFGKTVALNLTGNIVAVATSSGEVVIFDKASDVTPWLQRQTILEPFIAADDVFFVNPNDPSQISTVLAISDDGRWLAAGSPTAGFASVNLVNGLNIAESSGTPNGLAAHGAISLYEKDINNIFTLVYTILSPTPTLDEQFGSSLVFGDNTLFVSAINYGGANTGRVYKLAYTTTTVASSLYNPVGSVGTTISLLNVTGIVPGLAVRGTGFTSGQTVVSVDLVANTIVISLAPDSPPDGQIEFTETSWKYIISGITSGSSAGSYYGQDLAMSNDNSTLLISAPGSSVIAGKAYVYKNSGSPYTINGTEHGFGAGIAVSSTGEYIAISSMYYDGTVADQGKVVVYREVAGEYVEYQTITNIHPETAQYFGRKISFANDFKTLVVYSSNGDTFTEMTIDHGTTTFDNHMTSFGNVQINSGRVDIYDRYSTKWIFSESLTTNNTENEAYGTGFAVSDNRIVVSAPFAQDQSLKSGQVYDYTKPLNVFSWETKHLEIDKPNLSKIKKAFLYNKKSNKLITYLDVIDPAQGKIPGTAEQELTYKTYYDPATYSVGDSLVNVDDGMAWTKYQVGALWWDLRTVKFIDSYDDDIVYRNSTWNLLAPDASVDIYEWVETSYLPSDWDTLADTEEGIALGISGTSLYGNSSYSVNRRYDSISSTFRNTYYYWVKNKATIPDVKNRNMSAQDVAQLIANPRGEGYQFLAITSSNSFSLVNIKPLLDSKDIVLSVEYWTVDKVDQNIHSEWRIISEEETSQIPLYIEDKWVDSLCGKDINGRLVPDQSLPAKLKYGVESRPRQGMFVNRFEALKQILEHANLVLKDYQTVNRRNISLLETFDPEPTIITGLYDAVFDTDSELRFASIGSFTRPSVSPVIVDGKITDVIVNKSGSAFLVAPYIQVFGSGTGAKIRANINSAGQIIGATIISSGIGYDSNTVLVIRDYSVLVHSDSGANNVWSIYSYDPIYGTWSRVLSQTYDTRQYWDYIDWYASGYNQFSAADYSVETLSELNTILPTVGEIVKVRTSSSSKWILLEKYADTSSVDWTQQYKIVGTQDGTIQFSPYLYSFANSSIGYDGSLYDSSIFDGVASVELRNILLSLRNDIFVDDLKSSYLDLFFTSIRYILSEQTYVDWIFKTSFVKAVHSVGELQQKVSYKNDNLADFESYVTEVKPFRTKVREYISEYTKVDFSETAVTDFDLQPIYNDRSVTTIDTSIVDGEVQADNSLILSYPWKNWYDNVGFTITSIELVDGGSGYQFEPVVRITGGSGAGATARAFIANGKVNRIVLLTPGNGYLSVPTITIDGGLSSTGSSARAVAIIGNSVIRSSLIKMKFDRITQTYFITQLQETETFTGTGARLQWPLIWAPDVRIGQSSVMVNGITALRDTYKLIVTKSTSKGYTSYAGSIIFDTAVQSNATIEVTYVKDWSLLSAADRIQFYYDPATGELGKDLGQLMTGVDYGGVIVTGLGFESSSGWDGLPFYSEKWDSLDPTYDDYVTTVVAGTHTYTLPYIPENGTEINIYQEKNSTEFYISDGTSTVYSYDTSIQRPKIYVDILSTSVAPTTTKNVAGSFILSVTDTAGINEGDVVTSTSTTAFGYNTTVTEIVNSTDIQIDQILFDSLTVGTLVKFTHVLEEIVDVEFYANGALVLTTPVQLNGVINITGSYTPIRLDDNYYGTVDQTNKNAVMLTPIVGTTPSPVVVIDTVNNTTSITIPNTVIVNTGDRFTLRKSTSDGSIKPLDVDYDTALSGGNLAYSTATGLSAEDMIVDGDGFVTPTSSPAPEEVVPGQVVDAVSIKVFDLLSTASANVKVDNYIADGITDNFVITQTINSSQAVIVKVDSNIQTTLTDYVVNYVDRLVEFNFVPPAGAVISIFSFGFSGSNILDIDYFVGDGTTFEFITKAPWVSSVTSLIYIDGVPTSAELFQTDNTYDSSNRTGLRFIDAPPVGALINFVIVSGTEQTFAITRTERLITDGRAATIPYDITYNIGDSLPVESSMIVRVDQEILKSPNNIYFTIGSNRLNYVIDSSKFSPYSLDINDIVVLADGNLLSIGVDYSVDLSGITIRINREVYNTYSRKILTVSIRKDLGYIYIPPTSVESAKILFANPYDNTKFVEIITSYKHDVLDIHRTSVSVTSSIVPTVDTAEYYTYVGLSSGLLPLDRPVKDENYVWVIKNGSLLTPSVDYKVTDDYQKVQLALMPLASDEFDLITYSSNTLSSSIAYMQFKDMLNRVHFKRLSLDKQSKLAVDLHYNNLTIEVVDASNFDEPNPARNQPGIVEIRGERIEYFTKNGNVLGQLRRGTLGTSTPLVHGAGSYVQDIGPSETIPYTEKNTIETVISDGTNIVPLKFTPMKVVVDANHDRTLQTDWEYAAGFESTIPADYLQADDIEVFVQGTRLKKSPYKVYDVTLGPDSPAADVQYDAEFAVNGVDPEVRLTAEYPVGTSITVVQRDGRAWDQQVNIQQDNNGISEFLKAKPGIWYTSIK